MRRVIRRIVLVGYILLAIRNILVGNASVAMDKAVIALLWCLLMIEEEKECQKQEKN